MNDFSSDTPARIARHLRERNRFLVCAHIRPDGDALGSTAAMGWLLHALGKEYMLYNENGVPRFLEWLPLSAPVYTSLETLPFTPECLVVVDCGNAQRTGAAMADFFAEKASINIDHHLGNPCFGTLDNWVDPQMPAVGQMVAAVAEAAGVPLTGALAQAVYVALISDTGGFAFGNTTPAALRLAAHLAENGLDMAAVRDTLDKQWSLERMHLWGRIMQRLTLEQGGNVVLATVSQADIDACGADQEEVEGLAEHLRRLRGVLVSGVLREEDPTHCRLNLRSSGETDVRRIAVALGGGGHRNAAGCTLEMPLDQARTVVLTALQTLL